MKKIYCIETWWKEIDHEGYPKEYFKDGSFWAYQECPWKLGCFDFSEEFDNEEVFKKEILRIINNGGIIGKVWIKEEPDDYEPLIKL